jgi:hypothetical protein
VSGGDALGTSTGRPLRCHSYPEHQIARSPTKPDLCRTDWSCSTSSWNWPTGCDWRKNTYSELPINVWDSHHAKLCKTARGCIASRCSFAGAQDRWKYAIGEIVRFGVQVVVYEDRPRQAPGWPATAYLADYRHRTKPRNHRISSVPRLSAESRGEARYGAARDKILAQF